MWTELSETKLRLPRDRPATRPTGFLVPQQGSYPQMPVLPGTIFAPQQWSKEALRSQFRGFLPDLAEHGAGEKAAENATQPRGRQGGGDTLSSGLAAALHYQP